ncbi:fatty acid-binding protein, heart-like isoform X2 [Scyliorhinus canicula]|uniref:fatty acid-binding protein, heart-like isoform X2 n=1 Tax=Scyliorhinus canicula TaxID=7830 RepID=UPI0018F33E8B|nr:fatty acid-binding protein, heart-like isoform X2 [Scyliorhinus canicula]
MDPFVGNWRLVDTQNYDNYMRELGVDFATRQVGNVTKPNTIIKLDGDNVILQTKSTYRNTEIIFQLDKPFNEHTSDNRDCKKRMNSLDLSVLKRQLYHWKVKNWSRFRSGMESKQHLPEKSRMINSYWPLLFFLLSETSEIGYAKPLPGCSCF